MVERNSPSRIVFIVITSILLTGIALLCVVPMWHVIMSSISDGYSLFTDRGLHLIPAGKISFEGYKLILGMKEVWIGYLWTIIYVVSTTACGLLLTLFGGYYLSKKTLWQKPVSIFILMTMMFSGGLVPTYMVIHSLGLVNTPLAVIIPGCTNAIFIMMATTAFRQIPASIEEAAQIDGAGHWRIMFQISLPMAKGIMMVVAMNCVVFQWNNWFNPSIYLANKREIWPLQLVIKDLMAVYSEGNILASSNINFDQLTIPSVLSVISSVPILVACPFFQKYFGNMAIGGVKE